MAYDLYLGKMLMPVTPAKIQMAIKNQNRTITLIDDGEINVLKEAGLTTIQFTLLIPQVSYPFARYGGSGFVAAKTYLDYFEQLKKAKEPFQFIVSRCTPGGKRLFDTNLSVGLEEYTVKEDAGNGFDLEVSVTLRQYRHYATKTLSIDIPSPTAPILVNEDRPIAWNPEPSGDSGGGGGGSGGGSKKKSSGAAKSYKVQIVGMGVVTVKASSPAEAITKAAGDTWKGTIYVDGEAYNGETKQKATANTTTSSGSGNSGGSGSSSSKLKSAASALASGVVSKVLGTLKKTVTNPPKKSTNSASSVKSTPKARGTKFATVLKR